MLLYPAIKDLEPPGQLLNRRRDQEDQHRLRAPLLYLGRPLNLDVQHRNEWEKGRADRTVRAIRGGEKHGDRRAAERAAGYPFFRVLPRDDQITCPLSITSTAWVLRPKLASMSIPRSRASCPSRFTGAESGLTMAITRWADTMFPNAMRATEGERLAADILGHADTVERLLGGGGGRPTSFMPLLQILDLFPDLLDLRLHVHHVPGDLDVRALRAHGVGLPVDLLDEEVHLPPDGHAALQHLPQLGEVAVEPHRLLVHRHVLTVTKADEDLTVVSADICAVLEEALRAHAAMRETEGKKLTPRPPPPCRRRWPPP